MSRAYDPNQTMTRAQATALEAELNRQGLSLTNIMEGVRNAPPPDYLASPPHKAQDRLGNNILLPGNAANMTAYMPLSGNSLLDIKQLQQQTGQGGAGSGEVWHHMANYNSTNGHGAVVLMDQKTHAALAHVGGSAQARADIYDDPDRRAKLGLPIFPYEK